LSTPKHIDKLKEKVFRNLSPDSFNELALEIFCYQVKENMLYRNYVSHLGLIINNITDYRKIPFLPIGFYKRHRVVSGSFDEDIIFESSGTGGMQAARHYVKDAGLYEASFMNAFRHFYGEPKQYRFLALLPSYLERDGSSLVYMARQLIEEGGHEESGFFLDEHDALAERLELLSSKGMKAILLGVSFALIDFAENYGFPLAQNIIVMETGGMKGRKEELTRDELHQHLKKAFQLKSIHSEYGMTELLSQAYSMGGGRFKAPPWMKVLIRDVQDPFNILPAGKTGALNIIDLANIHSCSFIETQDLGMMHADGSFEVLGRTDHSDIRGCSLLLH